ncbi:MAG: leucine-rich repeat domain-containing protein [Acidobacteriota bacterium]
MVKERPVRHYRPHSAPQAPPIADPRAEDFVNPFRHRRFLRYFRDVEEWHGYIRFVSLPQYQDDIDIRSERLFVEPELCSRHLAPEELATSKLERHKLLNEVVAHPRLVLLGDPGSGKSTLVSWIARCLAGPESNAWVQNLGPLLPIPIVLRELRLTAKVTWESLWSSFLNQPVAKALGPLGAEVQEFLDRGQAYFLLDGLDELAGDATREALRRAALEGMARYPACRWLLTSRAVGYDSVPFHQVSWTVRGDEELAGEDLAKDPPRRPHQLEITQPSVEALGPESHQPVATLRYLSPFSDRAVQTFARLWFDQRTQANAASRASAESLWKALCERPNLLAIARVPNLLTLIALIFRKELDLPDGRPRLYDKIAEAYLETIDTFYNLSRQPFSIEQKKRWLGRVGFEMQRLRGTAAEDENDPGGILLEKAQVLDWLVDEMHASGLDDAERVADAFLDYIGRRSGLLLPRGKGVYAFSHLSFQEYFAAVHLLRFVTLPDWPIEAREPSTHLSRKLASYPDQIAWLETLSLLIGMLADNEAWRKLLLDFFFGLSFEAVRTAKDRQSEVRAQLLAEVSTDVHSGFSRSLREEAWAACWERELKLQEAEFFMIPESRAIDLLIAKAAVFDNSPWNGLASDTSLEKANLGRTQTQDASPLQNLTNLKTLDLSATLIQDASPLQNLTNLKILYLSETRIQDASPLQNLTNLEFLTLDGTQIQDASPLQNLTNLKNLYLDETQIQDASPLQNLTNLEFLTLNGTQIQDTSPLQNLANLKNLYLDGTQTQDASPLQNLTNLKILYLDENSSEEAS